MKQKKKIKTGAPPRPFRNEPDRQKEIDRQRNDRQKEIERLGKRCRGMRNLAGNADADDGSRSIREQVQNLRANFTPTLGPWQRAQISRHQQRLTPLDFYWFCCSRILWNCTVTAATPTTRRSSRDWENFTGAPWPSSDTKKARHEAAAGPEFWSAEAGGYRKAPAHHAASQSLGGPVFTFIDTPGAYPGIDAEERGRAKRLREIFERWRGLPLPVIVTVTGEGGSARGAGDCGRGSRQHSGETLLFGEFAGRVRFDHLADRRKRKLPRPP